MSEEDATLGEFADSNGPSSSERVETAIGKLPSDWGVEWLDDICSINPDGFSEDEWPDETFEYISLSNVSEGTISQSETTAIDDAPSRAQRRIKEGDVLVGTVRPKQVSHGFVTEEHDGKICSSGFGVLRSPASLNPHYLLQEVLSRRFFRQIEAYVAGSGYPAVKIGDLRKHRIALPPLEEQRKIASVLYTVDQAIQKTDEIESQLQRTKRGLVQNFLTEGVSEAGVSETDTKLGQLPNHWKVVTIESIVADEKNAFTDGARYSLSSDEIHTEGGARAILLEEVGEGEFNDSTPKFATQEKYNEITHRAIYPGEVVVAKMAEPVARACIVPETYDKYLLGCADVVRIVPDSRIDDRFLMYCMNSYKIWRQAVAHLRGTGRSRINLENIAELKIPMPPIEEQTQTVEVLSDFDNKIKAERRYRVRLQCLKQGLMQDLLSGQVRTTDANIEILNEIRSHEL